MARLPQPGGDDGSWGEILNDYLSAAHNSDGTLKDGAVSANAISDASLSPAKLDSANTATSGDVLIYNGTKFAWGAGGSGGVTDHGALSGLADDDHLQYHTDARGDARYYTQAQVDASLATKAPTAHTHAQSDVTGLTAALASKEATITAGTTAQYWRGDKSWQTLDKTTLGLANVDNTSDANKPVSTATQTALDGKETAISAGTTAQYWRGDKSWQTLDKTAVGLANVDNTSDANKPVSTATQSALNTIDAKIGAKVYTSASAPSSPAVGDVWIH